MKLNGRHYYDESVINEDVSYLAISRAGRSSIMMDGITGWSYYDENVFDENKSISRQNWPPKSQPREEGPSTETTTPARTIPQSPASPENGAN